MNNRQIDRDRHTDRQIGKFGKLKMKPHLNNSTPTTQSLHCVFACFTSNSSSPTLMRPSRLAGPPAVIPTTKMLMQERSLFPARLSPKPFQSFSSSTISSSPGTSSYLCLITSKRKHGERHIRQGIGLETKAITFLEDKDKGSLHERLYVRLSIVNRIDMQSKKPQGSGSKAFLISRTSLVCHPGTEPSMA